MKKTFLTILIIITFVLTGCANIHAIEIPNETTRNESEETSQISLTETEFIQMTSLEAEVEKMQYIIFATALSAYEYNDCNLNNESLIWNSIYNYFLITEKSLNDISVKTMGNIFSGFFGKEGILDENSFDKKLVKLNKDNLTYDFTKEKEIDATYYIQTYNFDRNADIVIRINIFNSKEDLLGSFDFILTKTKVITHVDNIEYKYKIKSFKLINN